VRKTVREYLTPQGVNSFRAWLATLDMKVRARLQARVLRFEMGNLGDHKALGEGVWEARVAFGPGYRIYFGQAGEGLLEAVSEGAAQWLSAVPTGMKDLLRIFAIRSSPENFCSPR
jgi:putative addiction module killer protein